MATHFLRPLLRPTYVPLALTGLGVTAYSSMATRRVHRLDTLDNPRPFYGKDRLVKEGGGLDAKTVRQISQGAVGGRSSSFFFFFFIACLFLPAIWVLPSLSSHAEVFGTSAFCLKWGLWKGGMKFSFYKESSTLAGEVFKDVECTIFKVICIFLTTPPLDGMSYHSTKG